MLEDMHVVVSELASVSFQVRQNLGNCQEREKKKKKECFRPGSNRGPCACEAHVITATLRKLDIECSEIYHFYTFTDG